MIFAKLYDEMSVFTFFFWDFFRCSSLLFFMISDGSPRRGQNGIWIHSAGLYYVIFCVIWNKFQMNVLLFSHSFLHSFFSSLLRLFICWSRGYQQAHSYMVKKIKNRATVLIRKKIDTPINFFLSFILQPVYSSLIKKRDI